MQRLNFLDKCKYMYTFINVFFKTKYHISIFLTNHGFFQDWCTKTSPFEIVITKYVKDNLVERSILKSGGRKHPGFVPHFGQIEQRIRFNGFRGWQRLANVHCKTLNQK